MKKLLIIILIIALSTPVFADIGFFDGGLIGDETLTENIYYYEEVLFISGKPITVLGTIQIPEIPTDQDSFSLTYNYELRNIEGTAAVDRTATFDVTKVTKADYNQTTYKYELSQLDETITVDGVEYSLGSKKGTKTFLYDNTAAVDYFSGNTYLKRIYYINGDSITNSGKVEIEITSDNGEGAVIGYDHLWGNAETYMAKMTIDSDLPNEDYDSTDPSSEQYVDNFEGFVDLRVSQQTFSEFKYQSTAPQSMSFGGSYVRVDEIENIYQFNYDLPYFDGDTIDYSKRNKGEDSIRNDKVVDGSSMVVPTIRDIGGHWGQDNIFFLSSLEIINNKSEFYGPDQPLTRIEFAEMISNAIATIAERSETDVIRSLRPGATQMFYDIPNDYDFYNYVVFAYNSGIMSGDSNGYFHPDSPIIRAEVITIMINALGLENRAPQLPFETRFVDDDEIPNWSKRFIYMADEIGLVTGFPDDTIKPNSYVTRAEGAAMVVNLINHMKDNIRIDFRDKIINRY